jgi:transaldolase/glucose-6-phosphate isomerase
MRPFHAGPPKPIVAKTRLSMVRKEYIEIVNTARVESRFAEFPGDTLPLPTQAIYPGILESAHQRELQNLSANSVLARLWAKDTSLWPAESYQTESVKSNLGWLDLPKQLEPLLSRTVARAVKIEPEGFEDVVFVTMGDFNLAAESILRLPAAKLGKRTFLLDNIDPDSLRAFEETLHLDRTLFVFASKSGKDIETHSLLLYFLERLRMLRIQSPARHFITLTEENSYLAELAGEYGFLDSFLDPPGIHSRYSSLIHFNFFLAALCRLDPSDLLVRMQSMRDACGPSVPQEVNPAVSLGAFLAAAETEGLDRVVFFSPDSLEPVARRIGYLVGASTAKKGRGIVPIFGGPSCGLGVLKQGCPVTILKMAGEEERELGRTREELREARVPMVTIELNGPEELAVEPFKWEIATALTCSQLGVDPFHDPDIRESRSRTVQILDQIAARRQSPAPTVRVREGEIELYAEGETRQQISTLNMTEALRTFFGLRHPEGYIALLPFVGLGEAQKIIFRRIRERLESTLGLPLLVTPGPNYLHAIGQVYEGGPAKGLFLLLTAAPLKDLAIPGAEYSFGQLQLALAQGEFESLGHRQRPVIRLHLARGAEPGLLHLEAILNSALGKSRIVAS